MLQKFRRGRIYRAGAWGPGTLLLQKKHLSGALMSIYILNDSVKMAETGSKIALPQD